MLPAYEDVHYYLWKEHRLPANVVAEDSRLRDPLERERMAKLFGRGLASPVGHVLPLCRSEDGARWQTGRWHFRGGTLFLIPGDSSIGYRLPLDALPWADPESIEPDFVPDPFAASGKLPPAGALWAQRAVRAPPVPFTPVPQALPVPGRAAPDVVRTALAVEPRDGLLHVFLPPLYTAEAWLDLIAAIEATAAQVGRAGGAGGLRAAVGSAFAEFLGDAGSGRDRGEHPSVAQLGRACRAHGATVRRSAAGRAGHREVHDRRPPCRHRRGQPRGHGRGDSWRTARSCAGPIC